MHCQVNSQRDMFITCAKAFKNFAYKEEQGMGELCDAMLPGIDLMYNSNCF